MLHLLRCDFRHPVSSLCSWLSVHDPSAQFLIMRAKTSSAAPNCCTKVLVIALLAASGIIATSIPESVARTVKTRNVDEKTNDIYTNCHVLPLIKRHLRSTSAKATSGRAEEKTIVSEVTTVLAQTTSRLHEWWLRKKSPSDLFTYLTLDQIDIHHIFASPDFTRWVKLVMSNHPNSKKIAYALIYSALSRHFKDDDALDKVLVAQLNVSDDDNNWKSAVAEGLLRTQFQRWKRDEKTVEEIFQRLNLHEATQELFDSSAFMLWADFARLRYYTQSKAAYLSMYRVLSGHYNGNDALDKVLVARLHIKNSLSNSLLSTQVERWMKDKRTAEEIYKRLDLHKAEGKLFNVVPWLIWVDFVMSSYHPLAEEARRVIFETLSRYYNDEDLAKVLIAGIQESKYEYRYVFQQLLQTRLLKGRISGESDGDVCKLLQLDQAGVDPMGPILDVYNKVVALFQKSNLDILKAFQAAFGDVEVAEMMEKVIAKSSLVDSNKWVKALQVEQFQQWKERHITPETIQSMLGEGRMSDEEVSGAIVDKYDTWYDELDSRYIVGILTPR